MAACSALTAATLPSAAAAPAGQRRPTVSVRHPGGRRQRLSGVLRCSAGPSGVGVSGKRELSVTCRKDPILLWDSLGNLMCFPRFWAGGAVAELWRATRGAPPGIVLAAVAAAAVVYKVASGLLAPPPPPPLRRREVAEEAQPPAPEPVEVGEITADELQQYDGSDPEKPLLMAIKGQIYDVSQSRMFYGPGGPYALFAGKDASRALAKMSFEPQDLTGDISGLGSFELSALQDWEYKFASKYAKVGSIKIKSTAPVEEGDFSTSAEIQEEVAAVKLNGEKAP
ncbi:hypothetical protein BRADI_3g30170v3 [Brachypodium distachyon]|uniref:Cytochrome b5 heme-binding domain-containing protein n=1 Tax=Brachypodium distachyon TaxID=15368 RepID=I1I562_BRADI|nr:hypothetical protein BRADI_3g30170v3 [Brachypodium distachyon]